MKITCHACGAKYAIADEKVRGRRVKVRCKSCSEPIIVDGYAEPAPEAVGAEEDERTHMVSSAAGAAPPPAADAWSVNLSETDQRTMTTEELVATWNAGQLPADTYVWREGMADWTPVTQAPDLLPYLTSQPAEPPPAPEPAYGGFGDRPSAARVAGGRAHGGADLFGAAAAAGSEAEVVTSAPAPASTPYAEPGSTAYADAKMTGARNENSVLFSLDSLKAGLGGPAAKSSPSAPRPSAPKQESASLDDIMDLGGGGGMANPLFALQQNQALLAAPPPPPEPPPRPVLPSDPVLAGSITPMPAATNNNKLLIIVGGAVAAVAIIAVVIGVVISKSGRDEVAKADTSEKSDKKDKSSSASGSEKKDDKGETASDQKKDDSTEAKQDESAATAASAEKKPVTEEDKKRFAEAMKKEQEAKDQKKDETKKDEVTKKDEPSSGLASFNKGAAIAALGAAAAQASGCKRPGGPTGSGRATVTFAPSGRATTANVSGGEFPGSPVGSCVASVFRRANVPPFSGDPVTVSKSFSIAP